jgi:hypothetical protein
MYFTEFIEVAPIITGKKIEYPKEELMGNS